MLLAVGVLLVPALLLMKMKAHGSDHADTPSIAAAPGTDLTDLYIFPSPTNASNVVLVMNVHPVIGKGLGLDPTSTFDPNVLYQFKIDTNGDFKEDLVIQAKFTGSGQSQTVQIACPVKPSMQGTSSIFETPNPTTGTINTTFTLTNGVKVFAGAREDPFFIDLNQLFAIFPDRKTPLVASTLRIQTRQKRQDGIRQASLQTS